MLEILEDDRSAISGLASITQGEYAEVIEAIESMSLSDTDKTNLLRQATPEIMARGLSTNETLSAVFYDRWRELEGFDGISLDPEDFEQFSEGATTSLMREMHWAISEENNSIWNGKSGVFLLLAGGAIVRSLVSGRRENYSKTGQRDKQFKKTARVARPGACAYCIEKAYESMAFGDGSGGFHRYCRCGVAGIFRNDSMLLEPDDTLRKYEEDRAHAVAALEKAGRKPSLDAILSVMRSEFSYR